MASEPWGYHCTPGIVWVKDAGRTLLVQEGEGRSWSLYGAEAAIWDLLTLVYPAHKIIRILSVLLACTALEAKEILLATLRAWQDAGIVRAREGAEGG